MKRGCLFNLLWILFVFAIIAIEGYLIMELAKTFPDHIILVGVISWILAIGLIIGSYKLLYGNYVDVYLLSGIDAYDEARKKGLIRDLRKAQLVHGKRYLVIHSYLVTKPLRLAIENEKIISIKEELVAGVSSKKAESEAVKGAVVGAMVGGAYGAFVGSGIGLGEKDPRIIVNLTYKTQEGEEKVIRFIYPLLEQSKSKFFKKCYKEKHIPADYI